MGSISNYSKNKLLDAIFRGQPMPSFLVLYIGLMTSTGENGEEVDAGGYSRVPVSSSLISWSGTQGIGTTTPSNGYSGLITNNAPIQFPQPLESWGSIVSVGIYDSDSNGNLLFHGQLLEAIAVNALDEGPIIPTAGLRIMLDK